MSVSTEKKLEVTKEKKIETIKSLSRDLRDQLAILSDRIYSIKVRTIGDSPTDKGKEVEDSEDNSLSIIEAVLRTALSYGNDCHIIVTELDEEL